MNKAQCPNCGDVIELKSDDDWVCCLCYYKSDAEQGIFLDGSANGGKHAAGIKWLDEVYNAINI